MSVVIVTPVMLLVLATVFVSLIYMLRTPAGRWVLAALALAAIPLLLLIGMFSVRQVQITEHHEAQIQVDKSHQPLLEVELKERPTESAAGPRVNSPSTEIPVADSPADNEATEPVSYVERVYEPKLQRLVPGQHGGQPDWLRDLTYGSGTTQDQSHVTSERFATIDEARAQLFGKLLPQLEQDLKLREPRVGSWKPTQAQVEESGIIEREAVATYQLAVGEFNEPVHEVTWVYDLHRDASMGQLLRHWQRSITADRIPTVLAVLAGMAVLFAIASGVLYRSGRDTNSSSPRQSTLA